MGLLDKKERILDIVLTDKGRDLLSKNRLSFTYYAFSDEGVDYSGSLVPTVSSSLDNYVHRNLSYEADQRKGKDLASFLYTIPSREAVLPEFFADVNLTSSLDLYRYFEFSPLSVESVSPSIKAQESDGVVIRATVQDPQDRQDSYASHQKQAKTIQDLKAGKNVVGQEAADGWYVINNKELLNSKNGSVANIEDIIDLKNETQATTAISISPDVEIVTGRDSRKIELTLKGLHGSFPSTNGFLIEVFESGSDGRLTKVARNDKHVGEKAIEYGFDSYLELKVDDDA